MAGQDPATPSFTLDDKYTRQSGRVYLSGIQALARLPMLQKERDAGAGLNTAGFISGYRGSPLGGLDQALWKARDHLAAHAITFQPGINEDLAATACWGSQQLMLFPGATVEGVFALWYGKGPGVDRCGDVFKHANAAGTSALGGVLVVAGDDHAARSSTLPHQSEHMFKAALMPVLAPAGIQEYIDYGLAGWALSRYCGCWVAFKAVADTVESSASVDIDPARLTFATPSDFRLPAGGVNIRWPDPPLEQEARLLNHKLYAALAWCRANKLNRIVIDSPQPRLGILTAGKSYLDVRQALDDLGIDEALAAEIGIRLYKVGMVWPLEAEGVRRFAEGLEEILVVEEKRQMLEYQLKEELYNWREDVRPRVVGKFDEKGEWSLPHGDWLLPAAGELTPALIARVIAGRIGRFFTSPRIRERLAFLEAKEHSLSRTILPIQRVPTFCPGCPHNTSTQVPEGSRALAGIGCHYMTTWMPERRTATFSHMGGEGVAWVGQAPFTTTRHVFANLGDGTYFHSGILAIRQAIAASVPITYKILYNDAVAMTGGQAVDGELSVPKLVRQLQAEGVTRIVLVSDEPGKYGRSLPVDAPTRHRDELEEVQRELREFPGVSALVDDQTCAAEKRRRRKRGSYPDPARRVFINERVCEGCGDCGVQSSCMAILPLETEFGRKRAIDQSACNKDYSCLKGFCPSFVTVEGGRLKRGKGLALTDGDMPESPHPDLPVIDAPWGILVAGVGGTGVVTLAELIGTAAHLDGRGVTVLDQTGLAQKGGAVFSHIRIARRPEDIHAARIAAGAAHALIGGDAVVAASPDALSRLHGGISRAVVNCAETPTLDFTLNPDWRFPLGAMQQAITEATGAGRTDFIDATRLATALLGDGVATNLFLLGYAWQKGMVPVSLASLDRAVELNGVAVALNRAALAWGRRAAAFPEQVSRFAAAPETPPPSLKDRIALRRAELVAYQDETYAGTYTALVARVRRAESRCHGGTGLTEAAALSYFVLLAAKDEYEVARMYANPAFLAGLNETFEGDFKLKFHLAPPALDAGGKPRKRTFGPWLLPLLRILAKLKGLRGGLLDPFRFSADRALERQLRTDFQADVELILECLSPETLPAAIELAALPQSIRGYGHIKARNADAARPKREALRRRLLESQNPTAKAQRREEAQRNP